MILVQETELPPVLLQGWYIIRPKKENQVTCENMKISILFTLILIVSVFGFTSGCTSEDKFAPTKTTDITTVGITIYTERDLDIKTALNKMFTIELRSWRSWNEDFTWTPVEFNPKLLKVINTERGDIDRFTFLATAKGQTTLTMRYARATARYEIAEILVYIITID